MHVGRGLFRGGIWVAGAPWARVALSFGPEATFRVPAGSLIAAALAWMRVAQVSARGVGANIARSRRNSSKIDDVCAVPH